MPSSVDLSIYDCLSKPNECRPLRLQYMYIICICIFTSIAMRIWETPLHLLLHRHLIIKKLICFLCTHHCIIYYLVFRINKRQAKRLGISLISSNFFQLLSPMEQNALSASKNVLNQLYFIRTTTQGVI